MQKHSPINVSVFVFSANNLPVLVFAGCEQHRSHRCIWAPVVTPWGLFLLVLVDLLLSCELISVSWYVTNALHIVPRETANLLAMVPKDTPPRSNCTTQLRNYLLWAATIPSSHFNLYNEYIVSTS